MSISRRSRADAPLPVCLTRDEARRIAVPSGVADAKGSKTPALAAEGVSWSNVQRHQAEVVSGVVDISDAHQFDNGVTGADRRFGVAGRNEVFVTWKLK